MVYRIRIILDSKNNTFRDVEIKDIQSLWNLHLAIKNAFNLQGEELSVFNILDKDGMVLKSIPLEDMSDDGDGETMSDVYIKEAFEKVGDKIHFQYGLFELWEFFCELISIEEIKPSVNYPITVYRFGNLPLKAPGKSASLGAKSKKTNSTPIFEDDFMIEDLDDSIFSNEDDFNSYDDDDDDYEKDNRFDDDDFDDE